MGKPRWQIKLRRTGHTDRHYVQTLTVAHEPTPGDEVVVRDLDGLRVTAIIRSFENCSRPNSRFKIFAVEVDEIDRSGD